ncbi:MAG: hypothetical protein H6R00_2769 [Proteobacteria bacterium]|nr:hypothetical protein [Pseudomonadota bacterium]
MKRSFLSLSLSAALALSAVTGAVAAVDTGAVSSVISSLYSLPASAGRDDLITRIQALTSPCNSPTPRSCVEALQSVVSAARSLGLSGGLANQVASLARDTAANTPGVTNDPEYVALADNVDALSAPARTGAVGGGGPAGGGGPGGGNGGGNFGPQPDGAASAGVTG